MDTITQHTLTRPQPAPPTASNLLPALLPSATFLAADYAAGLTAGIVAASVTSATLLLIRRRSGRRLGIVLPASLAYVVLRAVAGVVTDSPQVFFGLSLGLSAATALGVAATAWTARPAAAIVIPAAVRYRSRTIEHPLYRRVAAQLTVAWAGAELAVTAWEATHLVHATSSQFVVTRTFVGWPLMAAWICVLIFYLRLRLDPLDHHLARSIDPAAPRRHDRAKAIPARLVADTLAEAGADPDTTIHPLSAQPASTPRPRWSSLRPITHR